MINKTFAANWKMYHGPHKAKSFVETFVSNLPELNNVRILIFPPAISLQTVSENVARRDEIGLGIQNIHWEKEGAFTGEHSAEMASSIGAEFALIGHSERRHLFGETDLEVKDKVAAATSGGLAPVVCVGETKEERLNGITDKIITRQLASILPEIIEQRPGDFLLAYEPVWAIGTGLLPEAHDIEAAHLLIRNWLEQEIGQESSSETRILYGGSVNEKNARELINLSNVDGLLIGGASLDPIGFAKIIDSAQL